ncbi:MAG: hypothetical protein M1335_06855 [Chloroflexi bacterium]|nr:hypothetical protein [Chloroflexota bacterium]
MSKKFALALVLVLGVIGLSVAALSAGCGSKAYLDDPTKNPQLKDTAKIVKAQESPVKLTGEALKNKITADINKDIDVYLSVRKNVNDFDKAFAGKGLQEIKAQSEREKKEGKLKVRVQTDRVLDKISADPGGWGEAKYTFTDGSYYADYETGKRLTEPTGKPVTFYLSIAPDDKGDWKITQMFMPKSETHK